MSGYFHHVLKASILNQVLFDAVRICRESHDATVLAEDTFIDDRNFLRWNDVLKTGMQAFFAGLNGATSVAQTSGGGGTTSDMPWRDKDEDYHHWAWRAMQYAHAKHNSGNKLRKSKGY